MHAAHGYGVEAGLQRGTVIAAIAVGVTAQGGILRRHVERVGYAVVVVVQITFVAQAVPIEVPAIPRGVYPGATAVIAAVVIPVAATAAVQGIGIFFVWNAVVVVVPFGRIALPIAVGVYPVAERRGDAGGAVVAAVLVHIPAAEGVERGHVDGVLDAVVVVVDVTRIAQAVGVEVVAVLKSVQVSAAAVVAAVPIRIGAAQRIERGAIVPVRHAVPVVVPVAHIA